MQNKIQEWYILRHGLTAYSTQGYGDKILSARILPEAVFSIEKMGNYLSKVPNSANYSSQLIRCVQTADIITRITGKVFTPDKRLNEFHQETFSEFYERVFSWFKEVNTTQPKCVLVCTHGAVIAALKHMLLEGDFSESQLLDYTQCGELLAIKDKKLEIVDFNI